MHMHFLLLLVRSPATSPVFLFQLRRCLKARACPDQRSEEEMPTWFHTLGEVNSEGSEGIPIILAMEHGISTHVFWEFSCSTGVPSMIVRCICLHLRFKLFSSLGKMPRCIS